jgi:Tfp pilus assembly protein PilF
MCGNIGASMKKSFKVAFVCVISALAAVGCAIPEREQDVPAPVTDTAAISSRPANSPAVVELLRKARAAMKDSRWIDAAQSLERAIRIEPHNSTLWHELAQVRYAQGNYEQAMQLANRSNALLDSRSGLRTKNDELIKASREALAF